MTSSRRTPIILTLLLSTYCNAFSLTTPSSFATTATTTTTTTTTITTKQQLSISSTLLQARNRRRRSDDDFDDGYYYDDEEEEYDDDYDYDFDNTRQRSRRPRRINTNNLDNSSDFSSPFSSFFSSTTSSSKNNQPSGIKLPSTVSQSLLAGTFVLGIGTGVTVDSQINTNPKDLASRDAVDNAAPNPTLCTTYGASAMAFDQRVFVSFNPFNVYVAQADVKPACVLRPANVVPVLQDRGLVNSKEVKQCKDNMSNTWAFVGDLNDYPQLSCVYKSDDAQNEFLSNPKYGIGEDVYDDDREILEAAIKNGKKNIKVGLTEGEKAVKAKAAALKSKNDALLFEKEKNSGNIDV